MYIWRLSQQSEVQQVNINNHSFWMCWKPMIMQLVFIFKVSTNGKITRASEASALVCWLHTHMHMHTVYYLTHQNSVNTYKNLFVTSSKWLWNAFGRHSIAGDNHSKQLDRSSAKWVGWGLIQRLLVVDWVYSSQRDSQVDTEFFFFFSVLWGVGMRVCVNRWTNVVYGIKDQS